MAGAVVVVVVVVVVAARNGTGRLGNETTEAPNPHGPASDPRVPRDCVTVLVRDPAEAIDLSVAVRARYGLTSAEARLATRLLAGERLEASAEALAITRDTARTHLRAILRKSGVSRQADFVRVAVGSVAVQVRPPTHA